MPGREIDLASGQYYLDQGANRVALQWADSLLTIDVSRLEILDIMMVAADRLCTRDSVASAIGHLFAAGGDSAAILFLEGAKLRFGYDFTAAAEMFRRGAEAAISRDDSISAVAALLAASDCLILGDRAASTAFLDNSEALVPATGLPDRWALEIRMRKAQHMLRAGANAEADPELEEILALARASGYRGLVCPALAGLGSIRVQTTRRSQSLPFYEESLVEAEITGDTRHQCRMLLNLAYNTPGPVENSARGSYLDEAERRIRACGHLFFLGDVDHIRGVSLAGQRRRAEAIAMYRSSIEKHMAVGNRSGECASRQRMGYNLAMQGRFLEAQANFETCLELMDEEKGWLANWVLWGLANVHRNLGNLDRALGYYERVIEVGRGLGSMYTVGWNMSEMGLTVAMLGRYPQAILLQHEAIGILEEMGREMSTSAMHARIGEAYFKLGNLNLAREHFEISFALSKNDEGRSLNPDAIGGLAMIHGQVGDQDRACEGFAEALAILRVRDDQEGIVWAQVGLADHQLAAGRPAEALVNLEQAESLLTAGRHYHDRARIGLLKARLAHDPGRAAALAAEALAAAREGGLPMDAWVCLSDLGEYQAALGDTGAAMASQGAAMDEVEALWLKVGAEELRRHLLGPAGVPYERMVNLLLASNNNRAAEALATAERSRSRILSQRLAVAGASGPTWLGGGLSAEEKETAAAIALRQSRLQEMDLEPDERAELKQEIRDLERDFHVLRLGNHDQENDRPTISEAHDFRSALATDETALYFFLGTEKSYLLIAKVNEVRAHQLPGRETVEAKVRLFLGLWEQSNSQPTMAPDFDTAAKSLFRFLIGQAAPEVEGAGKLVIIPDGLLHRLPFAALIDGGGHPLGDREIHLAPSLGTLAQLRSRIPSGAEDLDMVAIGCGLGDTGSNGRSPRINPFTERALVPLPEAENEARMVARNYQRSLELTGDQATEESFREISGRRAKILHIAAHGVADEKEVRRSFVVLNPSPEKPGLGAMDDGILQWYEISDLSLDVDLVTLSACQSAAGVLARGEGITGLTQAFLFAGARCVLASLTDVPDSYAVAFMQDFYASLGQGATAAAALKDARGLAREKDRSTEGRPLWAAFTLVGDGSVRVVSSASAIKGPRGIKILALLGLAAAGAVALRRRLS